MCKSVVALCLDYLVFILRESGVRSIPGVCVCVCVCARARVCIMVFRRFRH